MTRIMTEKYKWPEDPEFQRFARKLADCVTIHINNGGGILNGPSNDGKGENNCPVGTISGKRYPYSSGNLPPGLADFDYIRQFITAFDLGRGTGPYYLLGMAYRERFGYGNG